MGKRGRQRSRSSAPHAPSAPSAPTTSYADADGNVLELRGSLTPATRRRYADTLASGLDREDARQRAIELLFEHLTVSWTIAGVTSARQQELLGRYRMASAAERAFVLESVRAQLAAHFPEMPAP